MPTKLESAIEAARTLGPVFPLVPDAKTPLIKNWRNLATTDENQIGQWWKEEPAANIGVVTDGLVVVDVDPRNGGVETMQLLGMLNDFPKTCINETQSGGHHIVYRLPEHTAVRSGANRLGAGVDIKSSGGYIVAPGSTIGPRAYRYLKPRPLETAPQWILDAAKTARAARSGVAGERLVEEDDEAIERAETWLQSRAPDAFHGEIDDMAFVVAARLYDFGLSPETVREKLGEWSYNHAHPPMLTDRMDTVAASAGRNRQNAIGVLHSGASGFEPVEIDESKRPAYQQDGAPPLQDGRVQAAMAKFALEQFDEAADRALTHSGDPLVAGVIDRGTFSTWYGPPKSGKTFVVLDLCLCIAMGSPWAGRKTRQGAVVYVAAEGGRGIYKRLRALRTQRPGSEGAPLFLVRMPVDLLHGKEHVALLHGLCVKAAERAGCPVELVVIDTVSRALAGGDENSSQDMGVLVKNLDDLRERTGAHVLGVHHTGKDKGKGMRGSTVLLGAVDTAIQVMDETLVSTAQRDLDGDLDLAFSMRQVGVGIDATGGPVTSLVAEVSGASPQQRAETQPLTGREEALLQLLHEHYPSPTKFTPKMVVDLIRSLPEKGEKASQQFPNSCIDRSTLSGLLSQLLGKCRIEKTQFGQYVNASVGK